LWAGLVVSSAGAQGQSLAQYVPPDAEFVAQVEVKPILGSPLAKPLLEESQQKANAARLQLATSFLGFNPLTDVDRALLCGRIEDEDSILLVVQGKFDGDKLANLARALDDHEEITSGGVTIHQWMDEIEGRKKYGAVVGSTTVLLGNRADRIMDAVNQGRLPGVRRVDPGPVAAALEQLQNQPRAVYVHVIPQTGEGRDGKTRDRMGLALLQGALDLSSDAVRLELTAQTLEAADAEAWGELMGGALALLKLQSSEPTLREAARRGKVTTDAQARRVTMELELRYAELVDMKARGDAKRGARLGPSSKEKSRKSAGLSASDGALRQGGWMAVSGRIR
jgi:hypothetical protein